MSASTGVAVDPERVIVRAVAETLGRRPVILCGSRATGEADERSDYDLLVVVPAPKIPFVLRRMSRTAERLHQELGLPVSINPLPPRRLRRPGRSLLPWKVRFEGRVLAAPRGFRLAGVASPETSDVTEPMRSSYAASGVRYLIEGLRPEELALRLLPVEIERAVRKALRHEAQLRLLRTGRYASNLHDALALMGKAEASDLRRLAGTCDRPKTWFAVRDLLLAEADGEPAGAVGSFVRNLQYAALSAIRGRGFRARALIDRRPVGRRLEQAVVLLARSIGTGGTVDGMGVEAAAAALPPFLRPPDSDNRWKALRDVIEREWPEANPLLGL